MTLHSQHQGRQHGDGLLPGDAAALGLRHQEVVEAEVDLLSPDLLPGHVELVGQAVRVPGEVRGHHHLPALLTVVGQLFEISALDYLEQSRGLGPGPRDPEGGRQVRLEDFHHLTELSLGTETLGFVIFLKQCVLSHNILEPEVPSGLRVSVVDQLSILVKLFLPQPTVPLLSVPPLGPVCGPRHIKISRSGDNNTIRKTLAGVSPDQTRLTDRTFSIMKTTL